MFLNCFLRNIYTHLLNINKRKRKVKIPTDFLLSSGLGLRQGTDDVRISSIGDGQGAHAEVLAAGRAQLDVVAVVVVHAGLGQHRVVLDLGLPVFFLEKEPKRVSCGQLTGSVLLQPWNHTRHPRRRPPEITP